MTGRAVVIKSTGDPEIAGAIVDGMQRQVVPLSADELAVVKAELAKLKATYGVMKPRDDRYWRDKVAALDARYSVKPTGKVRDALTLVWAILWMTIQEWLDYLAEWNRAE